MVYEAEQQGTQGFVKRVAIKVIRQKFAEQALFLQNFIGEAKLVADLIHTNIVQTYHLGESRGIYFIAMELINGVNLEQFASQLTAKRKVLSPKMAVFVSSRIVRGLAYAHAKCDREGNRLGIVHRDVSFKNVMVAFEGDVKLTDFGIAKARGLLTDQEGEVVAGKADYMSPEQAEMSGLDIDTRTDVYSLGVLLYELLTGTTPFSSEKLRSMGYGEMQRVIAETEPPKPSTRFSTMVDGQRSVIAKNRNIDASALVEIFKGDLDWIVMKALEKDRTQRYETVNGLVADVGRHLKNEPVEAAAPTFSYQLQKFYRRNQRYLQVAAAVVVLLVAAACFSSWQAYRAMVEKRRAFELAEEAQQARHEAETARAESRDQLYHALVSELAALQKSEQPPRREVVFERIREALEVGGEDADRTRLRTIALGSLVEDLNSRSSEVRNQIPNGDQLTVIRLFEDQFYFGYESGEVLVCDVFTGERTRHFPVENSTPVTDLLFLEEAGFWVIAHENREIIVWKRGNDSEQPSIKLRFDVERIVREPLLGTVHGKVLICSEQSAMASLWDPKADSGVLEPIDFPVTLGTLPVSRGRLELMNPLNELLATSPDGNVVAILEPRNQILVWNSRENRVVKRLGVESLELLTGNLMFSPEGRYFKYQNGIGSWIFETADWQEWQTRNVNDKHTTILSDEFYFENEPGVRRRVRFETGEVVASSSSDPGRPILNRHGELYSLAFGVNNVSQASHRKMKKGLEDIL